MSDEKNTSNPTKELGELLTGNPPGKPPTVKDKTGKEWELLPLDLADLVDYHKHEGKSLFEEEFRDIELPQLFFLMFLSLRKTGCTKADLEAKKFVWETETLFMREFDMKVFNRSTPILDDLLTISGMQFERPLKADQPEVSAASGK